MLDIQTQLFEGQDIRLGPIDHESHPAIESGWTHAAVFMRLMELKPVRPLSPAMVKSTYESVGFQKVKRLFTFRKGKTS